MRDLGGFPEVNVSGMTGSPFLASTGGYHSGRQICPAPPTVSSLSGESWTPYSYSPMTF